MFFLGGGCIWLPEIAERACFPNPASSLLEGLPAP